MEFFSDLISLIIDNNPSSFNLSSCFKYRNFNGIIVFIKSKSTNPFDIFLVTYGLSKSMGVPIIAETRLIRNRNLYERYGFKCYNTWQPKSEENPVWFLIRHPSID